MATQHRSTPSLFDGMLGLKHRSVRIGNRLVGEGYPVYLIGEIGINHCGDLKKALELVDIAADAGMDAVKLQKRTLHKIYKQDVIDDPNSLEEGFQYLIPILKEVEFCRLEYDAIYNRAQERGLDFICTPFDEEAVDFLAPYNLPAFKIASGDMSNLILLEKVIGTGKPLIISTGMATLEEIDQVGAFLQQWGASCILLHAVSAYPTPVMDNQLYLIRTMQDRYGVPVGLSSHETGMEVSVASVAAGACIIERHITLDRRTAGPDHTSSLEPAEVREFVSRVRLIEEAMGGGSKRVSRIVIRNRETLSKSLVATRDIRKGEPIVRSMVTAKGPGKGLSPVYLYELIGKTIQRDLKKDDYFLPSDVEEEFRLSTFNPGFDSKWGFKGRFFDLDVYEEQYRPRFVEAHLNDKDLFYPFEENHGSRGYPFEIYLHYPTYWYRSVVNLASEKYEERREHIGVVQRVIDLARRISPHFEGRPKVVVHMGGMDIKPVVDNRHLIQLAYDSMRQLNRAGVVFLAENNPPRPWYFSGQWYDNAFCAPEEMLEFCAEFDVPMCFDFSHAKLYCNVTGFDFYEYVKLVAPITRHLHICDAYGVDGEGMQVGEGEIDMAKTCRLLAEHGDFSQMSWTPEIWQGHNHGYAGFLTAFSRLTDIPELQAVRPRELEWRS